MHFGIGIEPGANLNASSPFSRSPAEASKAVSEEPATN
jgi:hypothetical protein